MNIYWVFDTFCWWLVCECVCVCGGDCYCCFYFVFCIFACVNLKTLSCTLKFALLFGKIFYLAKATRTKEKSSLKREHFAHVHTSFVWNVRIGLRWEGEPQETVAIFHQFDLCVFRISFLLVCFWLYWLVDVILLGVVCVYLCECECVRLNILGVGQKRMNELFEGWICLYEFKSELV